MEHGGPLAAIQPLAANVYSVGGSSGVIMGLGMGGNSADMTWRTAQGTGWIMKQGQGQGVLRNLEGRDQGNVAVPGLRRLFIDWGERPVLGVLRFECVEPWVGPMG